MITGTHTPLSAEDADAARAFFREVLRFVSVDAGNGWLIFTLPSAELGIHSVNRGGRGQWQSRALARVPRRRTGE